MTSGLESFQKAQGGSHVVKSQDLTSSAWHPSLDRTVLMLHLDRLAHAEIGEVTGLTENHVGVRLHRIKRWLAAQKGEQDEP